MLRGCGFSIDGIGWHCWFPTINLSFLLPPAAQHYLALGGGDHRRTPAWEFDGNYSTVDFLAADSGFRYCRRCGADDNNDYSVA